jgi:acetyl esterase/lipase
MNSSWRLHGPLNWTLTLFGIAFALVLALGLFYMIHPVDFDRIGIIGLYVFLFPSQLLIISVLTAIAALIFWRKEWRWPSLAWASIALVALPMSLWPTLSLYAMARRHDVKVSLVDSLIPSITLGGIQQDKSVRYATVDGTDLMLDVWPTAEHSNSLRPAIVRMHGGGWIAGTRSELFAWNIWLNELGYVVFDVEYRLAPPVRWLDEVGDVKCALGWVAAHSEQYRIDANRISLMGNSAGGHLAMLAAYTMGDPDVPSTCDAMPVKVNAVVNIYGPSDLPRGYYQSGSPRYVQHAMDTFIGGPPEAYKDRYRTLSPLTYVNAKTPPTITLLGTSDRIVTVDQAELLDAALNAAGAPHETYLLPASDHGFDANWNGLSAQFARAKVSAFLARYDTSHSDHSSN